MFKGAPRSAISLLKGMLVFDPRKRMTITDVYRHRYFKPFHALDAKMVSAA
jgi:hypothetical protein